MIDEFARASQLEQEVFASTQPNYPTQPNPNPKPDATRVCCTVARHKPLAPFMAPNSPAVILSVPPQCRPRGADPGKTAACKKTALFLPCPALHEAKQASFCFISAPSTAFMAHMLSHLSSPVRGFSASGQRVSVGEIANSLSLSIQGNNTRGAVADNNVSTQVGGSQQLGAHPMLGKSGCGLLPRQTSALPVRNNVGNPILQGDVQGGSSQDGLQCSEEYSQDAIVSSPPHLKANSNRHNININAHGGEPLPVLKRTARPWETKHAGAVSKAARLSVSDLPPPSPPPPNHKQNDKQSELRAKWSSRADCVLGGTDRHRLKDIETLRFERRRLEDGVVDDELLSTPRCAGSSSQQARTCVSSAFLAQLLRAPEDAPAVDAPFAFSETMVTRLCDEVQAILVNEPTVLELRAPLKVFGDLHGQYSDLLRLFSSFGTPTYGCAEEAVGGTLPPPLLPRAGASLDPMLTRTTSGAVPVQPRAADGDLGTYGYLFLGDYVDRGPHSLEVVCLLLALKLRYPNDIHLLRGNHESSETNGTHGLLRECCLRMEEHHAGLRVWKRLNALFDWLPLAALVEKRVLCLHGGLGCSVRSVADLRAIKRPIRLDPYLCTMVGADASELWNAVGGDVDEDEVVVRMEGGEPEGLKPPSGGSTIDEILREVNGAFTSRRSYTKRTVRSQRLLADVLWSDPTDPGELGVCENAQRGVGMYRFGADVVKKFCDDNDLDLVVRAHECVMDGFERFAGGHLATVFSAPYYCGQVPNSAAILCLDRALRVRPMLLQPANISPVVEEDDCLTVCEGGAVCN